MSEEKPKISDSIVIEYKGGFYYKAEYMQNQIYYKSLLDLKSHMVRVLMKIEELNNVESIRQDVTESLDDVLQQIRLFESKP